MNKKATLSDLMTSNVVGIILVVMVFAGLFIYVFAQTNGAAVWEEYYAKEIARIILMAKVVQP